MRPRKPDPSFLAMAAIAGLGGILAIVLSIGLPIFARMHGRHVTPAFSLFACWGMAALGGAYACLKTYFIKDDPHHPPRGRTRLALVKSGEAKPPAEARAADSDGKAA